MTTMASVSMPLVSGLRRLFGNRAVLLGTVILVVVILAALLAPWVAPYAPNKLSIVNKLKPPSMTNLFGTNEFGRDIFSRAIFAGRISLLVSLGVVAISTVLGVILGVAAGFFRGLDAPISRLLDAMMSFPDILLAIALVAALGPNAAAMQRAMAEHAELIQLRRSRRYESAANFLAQHVAAVQNDLVMTLAMTEPVETPA